MIYGRIKKKQDMKKLKHGRRSAKYCRKSSRKSRYEKLGKGKTRMCKNKIMKLNITHSIFVKLQVKEKNFCYGYKICTYVIH